jgi:hypothetical protein
MADKGRRRISGAKRRFAENTRAQNSVIFGETTVDCNANLPKRTLFVRSLIKITKYFNEINILDFLKIQHNLSCPVSGVEH